MAIDDGSAKQTEGNKAREVVGEVVAVHADSNGRTVVSVLVPFRPLVGEIKGLSDEDKQKVQMDDAVNRQYNEDVLRLRRGLCVLVQEV